MGLEVFMIDIPLPMVGFLCYEDTRHTLGKDYGADYRPMA